MLAENRQRGGDFWKSLRERPQDQDVYYLRERLLSQAECSAGSGRRGLHGRRRCQGFFDEFFQRLTGIILF